MRPSRPRCSPLIPTGTPCCSPTVTDLNTPGTRLSDASANAINDSGVIVGYGGNGDAFVYQNGHATDLNSLIAAGSGFTLRSVTGTNDSGVIVGTASPGTAPGGTFGFELTPGQQLTGGELARRQPPAEGRRRVLGCRLPRFEL